MVKLLDWENASLHTKHVNGLSPVCIRLCTFKSLEVENVLSHKSQTNDFSPLCFRTLWTFNWLFCLQEYSQISQTNGLSSVCFLLCLFNKLGVVHLYWQLSQEYSMMCSWYWDNIIFFLFGLPLDIYKLLTRYLSLSCLTTTDLVNIGDWDCWVSYDSLWWEVSLYITSSCFTWYVIGQWWFYWFFSWPDN